MVASEARGRPEHREETHLLTFNSEIRFLNIFGICLALEVIVYIIVIHLLLFIVQGFQDNRF